MRKKLSDKNRVVAVNLFDASTGEIKFSKVRTIRLDVTLDVNLLRHDLDIFLKCLDDNPMISLQLLGYKRHEDMELPF